MAHLMQLCKYLRCTLSLLQMMPIFRPNLHKGTESMVWTAFLDILCVARCTASDFE